MYGAQRPRHKTRVHKTEATSILVNLLDIHDEADLVIAACDEQRPCTTRVRKIEETARLATDTNSDRLADPPYFKVMQLALDGAGYC